MKIPLKIAREIGCSADFLSKINLGERRPSVKLARKIVAALDGRITLLDLRPDLADLYPAAAEPRQAQAPSPGPAAELPGPKAQKKYVIDIFRAWCKECGICAAFCPQQCITIDEEGRPVVDHAERCTGCGWCELHCPDFAISVRPCEAETEKEEAD
jgi:2-oxoglutarate ferredoxin oxidoreductase subunit delta